LVLSQYEGGECLNDTIHIAKDKVLRLVINQKAPTPQAIGTWLRHLGKNNQGVKALQKTNKTLLKATLNNCKNITLDIDFHRMGETVFWLKSLYQLGFVCFFGFYFFGSLWAVL
jgi:hypothetical protein